MNRSEITELLLKCIGPQLDVITARLQLNQNILPAREQPNATRASAILVLVDQQDLYDQLGAILSEMFPRRSPAKKAQPSKPKKPRQSKSKEKQPKERCILILAANPVETDRLSIDKEVRLIKEKLREGDAGRQFRVESEWAVRYDDVSKFLLRYEPAIVHFSGHGSPTGRIILEDERGEAYPLSVEALARLFDILRGPTECIVLNACYSNAQARALSQIVGRVVGMEKEIGDVSALNFAGGFYLGLAYGKDYETAFKLGCNAIDMASLPDATLPHLTTREKDQVAEISYSDYGQAVVVTSPTRTWVDKGAASQPGGPLPPKLYPVWFGTSRSPVDPDDPSQGFTGVREPERVHYGLCKVAVPKSHKFGSTGSIWWKRLLTLTDDRLKLKELSALEETTFWDAVRRASAEWDVGKRSALVFIHGFGVSFNEAAIRAAQIGFDLKFPGVVAFFSWPSKGRVGLLSYKADEASVEANERQISDFLVGFARQSGADHVNAMALQHGQSGIVASHAANREGGGGRRGQAFPKHHLCRPGR